MPTTHTHNKNITFPTWCIYTYSVAHTTEHPPTYTNMQTHIERERERERLVHNYFLCQIFVINHFQVKHDDKDFGWGIVVNFQKKANQKKVNDAWSDLF